MSTVYLIPSPLAEQAAETILPYTVAAVRDCQVFFVENERTARRFLKSIWKEMVIDDYQWFTIHKAENQVMQQFRNCLTRNQNIGIISEAGCPGVADPGQLLVAAAQQAGATVRPLVGPSAVLLAVMASGLNGQQFRFNGYLPVDQQERSKAIRQLEQESLRKNCTELFIETPYRNNQMLETLLRHCQPATRLCVAVSITGTDEWIKTKTIAEWKKDIPDLHKRPAMFCILATGSS